MIDEKIDDYINKNRYRLINSVLIYRDGELITEKYYNGFDEKSKHKIKSIWKSILSLCVGICIDKGLINSVDDKVGDYVEEFDGRNNPYHRFLTIKHLLTMSSGIYWNGSVHYHCPMLEQMFRSSDWIGHIADIKMADFPGRENKYKEWDIVLISKVIEKASNMRTFDFCNEHLYKPLEIECNDWARSKCGTDYTISYDETSENLSNLSSKDLLALGKLILSDGMYDDKRIVSRKYLEEACAPSELNEEYGYLFILGNDISMRGYGGQEVVINKLMNMVYVSQASPTSGSKFYHDLYEFTQKNIL